MDKPLVSIAMATYNGASYLELQLESIFQQDYWPMEIVVVDDCSSDETANILEKYSSQKKLRFYKNPENVGYVKNFERALTYCQGEFIALADQDDVWKPNKISTLINAIGSNLLIHSDAILIDENGSKIADSYQDFGRKMVFPSSITDLLLNGCVTGCTTLIRRALVEKALPFPNGLYIHDKWLGVLAFLNRSLVYHEEQLIEYRQHSENSIGVSQHKSTISLKIKNLLRGKKNPTLYLPFRSALLKEYTLILRLLEKKYLGVDDEKSVIQLKFFFRNVLTGSNIYSIVGFFIQRLDSFEKNKTWFQKLYFFYLIVLAYYYSTQNRDEARIEILSLEELK